jgi:hypothetical protein
MVEMADLATGLITVAVAVVEQVALAELQLLLKLEMVALELTPIHLGYQ